jgi:hypothetical protein
MEELTEETIKVLLCKARDTAQCGPAVDVLQLTQAAVNVANALACFRQINNLTRRGSL